MAESEAARSTPPHVRCDVQTSNRRQAATSCPSVPVLLAELFPREKRRRLDDAGTIFGTKAAVMRPPRTPSASPDAPAGGAAPVALPFSGELTVRDHARLAERLADDIGRLRQARLSHHDFPQVRDRLEAFLTDDLIPYLHAEEAALSKAADRPHRRGWWGSRRPRRRLREHRRVIDAAHALRRADTPVLALARAERVRALFFAHLIGEDREFLATAGAGAGEHPDRSSGTAALTAELDELRIHDHARITAAIAAARDAAAEESDDELGACDRAVAALSQHAAVMATRAYPMVRRVLSDPERAALRPLTGDLRCAERAMRHLNRLLRGAAGESDNRERLWTDVERAWQQHVADEEPLVRQVAPVLGPERVASLMTLLRRPVGHSLTRPHPLLLHGGWPTGLAIRAQYRIDEWRDVLDNRVSWRSGG